MFTIVGPASDEILLTVDECAFLLGLTTSPIYQLIKKGRLAAVRILEGGHYRIPATELRKFGIEYHG